jgi:hypothetical protein
MQSRTLGARLARAITLSLALAAGGLAAGPAGAAELGTYKGNGLPGRDAMPRFESWLGREIPHALDFFANTTWSDIVSEGAWVTQSWRGQRWSMTFSIPMLPNDWTISLADGQNGQFNGYFRLIARDLVAKGFGSAIIRLGWEFNGGWYRWAAAQCPSCYAGYWQQIVTTMRAVPGASFRFDWTMALGHQQVPAEKAYPGDDYVDIIGVDVYNDCWDRSLWTPTKRWANLVNQDHGLQWHADFAAAHHKPISFPEWGTGVRPGYPGVGGGDDPYFIEQMHNWIQSHNVAYHDYWDYQAGDYRTQLSNNQYPNAGAAFRRLFGPGS